MKPELRILRVVCGLFLLSGLWVTLAYADTLSDIHLRKQVRIAVDLGVPPFGMTDANMQPQGSDVEVARMIAKDLGAELEWVPVTGPDRIAVLLSNKADLVISSFSVTPARERLIAFSQPYGALRLVIAAPRGSSIHRLSDLVGKHVGVVRGNLQDTILTPMVPQGTSIARYDNDADVDAAFLSGEIDALCSVDTLVQALARRYPNKQLEIKFSIDVNPYAIGMRKEDQRLLEWINHWIATNMKNGRLQRAYEKWTGSPFPELNGFGKN